MPWGIRRRASLGSLFGKTLKSIPIQRQSSKVKPIQGKRGESRTISAKKRGNLTHTHSAEGENYEGKIVNPGKQHVRLETRTHGQFDKDAVCTNTNALRLPLILIRKVLRHTKKTVQKFHRKLSPRGQQNTYSPKTKAENKSSKSFPSSESCDHRSNRRGILTFPLRRHRRRPQRGMEGAFHRAKAPREVLKTKTTFTIFKGWSMFCWFIFVATETDRSLTPTHKHTHTRVYTHKYTEKLTSNVCIAPIFVPFCDKYLILSFLVFLTFTLLFSHTHTTLCLILVLVFSSHTTTKQ